MNPNDDSSSDDEGINEILRINSGDLVQSNNDDKKRVLQGNTGISNSPIKRIRKVEDILLNQFIWNEKLDELLSQFANDNPNDWVKISEMIRAQLAIDLNTTVSLNPDPIECAERWTILNAEVFIPWSDEEVRVVIIIIYLYIFYVMI